MPCDHALVKCANCGAYVREEEWIRNGTPAAKPGAGDDSLTGRLTSLFLAGERHQFCSAECEAAFTG